MMHAFALNNPPTRGASSCCTPRFHHHPPHHNRQPTQNADRFDSEIIYDRDFDYDYFGFKTLERSYLLRLHGKVRVCAFAD